MNSFGARLRRLRKNIDLSQEEVAIALGYSRVQVSNWEIERSEPDFEALNKLAKFFKVTVDYLTCRVDNPTDELVPITTEPPDPNATYMNDPIADDIMDDIKLMSREDKETIRRLTRSIVNRKTQGVS